MFAYANILNLQIAEFHCSLPTKLRSDFRSDWTLLSLSHRKHPLRSRISSMTLIF